MSPDTPSPRLDSVPNTVWARKSKGQHFLLDANLNRKIVSSLDDVSAHIILEIGPGPGGLTRALLERQPYKVMAIEKDDRFADALQKLSDAYPDKLLIRIGDALELDERAWIRENDPERSVILAANLPYNVGTPLLTKWLTADPIWWQQAILMFQKEVAERIVAVPGTSEYGRLSILAQSVCHVEIKLHIKSNAYVPPPKVDSAVVKFVPRQNPCSHLQRLQNLTQVTFSQRRKMLRRSLKPLVPAGRDLEAWLSGFDIDPMARPETLTVEQFERLAASLDR